MESTTIIPARLVAKARELALPDTLARDLLAAYSPFASAITDIKAKIAETDALTPDAAREFRLATVKIRTGSDKVRKELKADSLLRGKAIDGLNALVEIEATAVETAMEDIERAAARAEAARVLKLRDERRALIAPYVADPAAYLVEAMTEEVFAEALTTFKFAAEARAAAAAKVAADAEAARLADEARAKARAEADMLAAAEAARLRAEEAAARAAAAAAAKVEADKQAAAKAAADALAAAAQREADAKAAAERAEAGRKAEVKRAAKAAAEQAKRIEQMEAAAKATRLREEAEARDAEARAETRRRKQEDDRKAVVARIAADLGQLKRDGKIGSMTALAECIVSGGQRGVTVDWDAA
jgi:hypothetical protein